MEVSRGRNLYKLAGVCVGGGDVKSSVLVLHMAIISLTEVNRKAILIFFT